MSAIAPSHGPVECARCWVGCTSRVQESGIFRLVRDPGHWGASDPLTLVLGISKGNTQARAFGAEPFDGVAFKGIRSRLLDALKAVGQLLGETTEAFERRFTEAEGNWAFASVVRCSITGRNSKTGAYSAGSPEVLPAFEIGSSAQRWVDNCIAQHLAALPPRTERVVLLGNSDAYVETVARRIGHHRGAVVRINPVAFRSKGVRFVHIAHPSRGNGHFGKFINGTGTQGMKRLYAEQALREAT